MNLRENSEDLATSFSLEGPATLADRWGIMPPLIDPELVERANAAETLRYWNGAFKWLKKDKVTLIQLGKNMDVLANKEISRSVPWLKLQEVMLPVFAQAGQAFARYDTDRACTLALIDALQFNAKTGKLPLAIKNSTKDLYGDGRLRYLVTKEGFRIYSVGPDLKDEGGISRNDMPRRLATSNDDFVVAFPNISSRRGYNLAAAKERLMQEIGKAPAPTRPKVREVGFRPLTRGVH